MQSLKDIENAFNAVKSSASKENLTTLSAAISDNFNKRIDVTVITGPALSQLVMAVTPDSSALDHVIKYATNATTRMDAVVAIWRGAKYWTMEINKNLISKLSARELTAITCHEVYHVIYSDRTITRLKEALQFMVGTNGVISNGILAVNKFAKILRIPGIVSTFMNADKAELAQEVKSHEQYLKAEMNADSFSSYNGYRTHLINAIDKIDTAIMSEKSGKVVNQTPAAAELSSTILSDLAARKNNLAKDKLGRIAEVYAGTLLAEEALEISERIFSEHEPFLESADIVPDKVFMEAGFFKRKLERIEQNQIDYITVKCNNISSVNEQLMVVSYINSKLEIIDYYMGILSSPSLSQKYIVPHSMNELKSMKANLLSVKEKALSMRTAEDNRHIIVYYPKGYEG